jgi:transcriptional regulator with XRE-family HTH domain
MSRPKNQHVVALLRKQLGHTQASFAAVIESKERTIQDIELGIRPISIALADKISRQWNVSVICLRQNDLKGGLRDTDGKPWTTKSLLPDDRETKLRQNEKISWSALSEARLHFRVLSTYKLVTQFQTLRDYLEKGAADEQEASAQWEMIFRLGFAVLDKLQTEGTYHRQDCGNDLELTLGDLQQLDKALKIFSKKAKKLESSKKSTDKEAMRTLYADRFGWDERGLEAYELAVELGKKPEDRHEVDPVAFDSMLNQRLKEKGMHTLFPEVTSKRCFEAIKLISLEVEATTPLEEMRYWWKTAAKEERQTFRKEIGMGEQKEATRRA